MQNLSQKLSDTTVGAGSISVGSVGLTIQMATDVFNLGVAVLNFFAVLGGLVLIYFKIRDRIRQTKKA